MKGWELIKIKGVKENDGTLCVMETGAQIPFSIKRIFWVSGVACGQTRGNHATKKTRLVLFPVAGSCKVLVDDGKGTKETFVMNDPTTGLLIEPMIWRSMQKFTSDCVMMAVCDMPFNPGNETIDDYDIFADLINNRHHSKQ